MAEVLTEEKPCIHRPLQIVKREIVGFNPVKIENGLLKYEKTNKFNIRVNNYRKGPGSSTLEKFVSH